MSTYNTPNWPDYNPSGRATSGSTMAMGQTWWMPMPWRWTAAKSSVMRASSAHRTRCKQGLADANDGISLALYAEQEDGSRTPETIPADAFVRLVPPRATRCASRCRHPHGHPDRRCRRRRHGHRCDRRVRRRKQRSSPGGPVRRRVNPTLRVAWLLPTRRPRPCWRAISPSSTRTATASPTHR